MKSFSLAEKIIDSKDIQRLINWLKTNPHLTKGELTVRLEKKWANWIGTKYAVFCNSGSSANLLMAYAALISGKLRNKKVIVPSVGWVTTIAPFIQFGFSPVMCAADKNNFGLDFVHLEMLLKKHDPASVAMVQVLGVPSDMDKLLHLQKKYNFLLLEDACAALGSEYNGKKLGSFGDLSTFSFYFGHQLSTIEGGMINTNNQNFYFYLLMLRSHGWGKDLPVIVRNNYMEKYKIDNFHKPFTFFIPGFNLRSTELNAYLGLEQMKKADAVVSIRTRNHYLYAENLKNVEFQKLDHKAKVCSISFGVLAKNPLHRKRIVNALNKHRIETRLFSAGNLGLHPFWYERYGKFHDDVADRIHNCGFFLPNNESIKKSDVLFICKIVNKVS